MKPSENRTKLWVDPFFWARKGSDPAEAVEIYEVDQNDLNFWQALSRCMAYVAYTLITETSSEPDGAGNSHRAGQ
jgi:hypothetical protein